MVCKTAHVCVPGSAVSQGAAAAAKGHEDVCFMLVMLKQCIMGVTPDPDCRGVGMGVSPYGAERMIVCVCVSVRERGRE